MTIIYRVVEEGTTITVQGVTRKVTRTKGVGFAESYFVSQYLYHRLKEQEYEAKSARDVYGDGPGSVPKVDL